MSRSSLARKEISLPLHELRLHRELRPGQSQGFLGQVLRDACQLEHDPAGLDDGDPVLRGALARAHACLGRLLADRLVRKDVDPDLSTALDLSGHGDSSRLDLAVRDPAGLHRLDAEVAELDAGLALRDARPPAALLLAVLRLLRKQHLALASRLFLLRLLGSRSRSLGRLRLCGRRLGGRRVGTLPAPGTASSAGAAAAHRAEALAILLPAAAALARSGEALGAPAEAARRVLVSEPRLLLLRDALEALGHDLAFVDPDLDADSAEGRLRLDEAVVDVRANRVQRNTAFGIALGAAHLGAAEPPAALHLNAVGAGAHRRSERALHRAPEADAVLELFRDRLGDELRVQLGALDLVDVDVHVLVRHAVDLFAQRVDLGA